MIQPLSDYFYMSGYGFYIWTSFGISAVVLIGLIIQSYALLKKSKKELSVLQKEPGKNETQT